MDQQREQEHIRVNPYVRRGGGTHGVIPPLQHETHVHQGVMCDHPANPGLSLRVL